MHIVAWPTGESCPRPCNIKWIELYNTPNIDGRCDVSRPRFGVRTALSS